MNDDLSFTLVATTEQDRTYIKRVNFLADVMGDETKAATKEMVEGAKHYVGRWDPENGGFVAYDNYGIPAGAVWLSWGDEISRGFGHVEKGIPELAIGVESRYRSKGVGTLLLKAAIQLARELLAPGISLSVSEHNPRAHKLYRNLGFEDLRYDASTEHYILVKYFQASREDGCTKVQG